MILNAKDNFHAIVLPTMLLALIKKITQNNYQIHDWKF
jgi:hypothetical protein